MKKDVTRRAVEKAAVRLMSARARFRDIIPYGPDRVVMTPAELRRSIPSMSPAQFNSVIQALGMDEAMRVLSGRPPQTETDRRITDLEAKQIDLTATLDEVLYGPKK